MTTETIAPFGPRIEALRAEAEKLADRFDIESDPDSDLVRSQTRYLLLKFFLQQIHTARTGSRIEPGGHAANDAAGELLNRVLDRDFGGLSGFRSRWLACAAGRGTGWVIGGLSFATFRFHLFPAESDTVAIPFCVSPILVSCVDPDIYAAGSASIRSMHEAHWEATSMRVIANRVACLQKPLELFEDPADCQEDSCAAG